MPVPATVQPVTTPLVSNGPVSKSPFVRIFSLGETENSVDQSVCRSVTQTDIGEADGRRGAVSREGIVVVVQNHSGGVKGECIRGVTVSSTRVEAALKPARSAARGSLPPDRCPKIPLSKFYRFNILPRWKSSGK